MTIVEILEKIKREKHIDFQKKFRLKDNCFFWRKSS